MISLHRSSNRWFSIIMIAVFMLFTTPTPSLEIHAVETVHSSSSSQGIEYNTNLVVRKNTVSESKRFASYVPALLFMLCAVIHFSLCGLPAARASFRPQIARRLTRMLLLPIKFTSLNV
ncbi:hypothetical protein [Paenibacillus radicis (ex Xue et al. 2023)]|uniref:Uncharacterized protein n=1 Tax=Paenibacillus radicis (ex Xue et al. 2023) TaxID=2972489 RepID=A0ABT1YI41_9BACL|nr:hypothetical protein [Paenibacillus radicis (ex Xue et al. 2023)]MCR8632853.1 hypothetical protein [Paenibacillus radicis (ex Xue et al. 2023)]